MDSAVFRIVAIKNCVTGSWDVYFETIKRFWAQINDSLDHKITNWHVRAKFNLCSNSYHYKCLRMELSVYVDS
ncbi:hypothetical protein QQP08_003907 [Theobroma cacao]|nr:hypothetical protein QQP08_003907 [Theobroma cacao]